MDKKMFDVTSVIGCIAIAVIVVSLVNLGIEMTGHATVEDTAVLNITVESKAAINFTTDFVDFGNGTVDDGTPNAVIDTESTVTNGSWSAQATGFVLENIGNVNVTLNISSDKDAATFLEGSSPDYKFKITDSEAGSCKNNAASTYTSISTSETTVCTPFVFSDSTDTIDLDVQLTIPSDSTTGNLTSTITAEGSTA